MRDHARIALAGLVAALSCRTSAATDNWYPARARVVAALERARPFDLRLTSSQPYRSCQIADSAAIDKALECRGAVDPDVTKSAAAVSVDVAAMLSREPTTDALWSAALLDVWSPDPNQAAIDRAVVRLSEVSAREKGRLGALALNDLAIAHTVRAAIRSNVGDLFSALDFAERAVAADSALVSARFNRAVLFDRLHIDTQAAEAWRALSAESNDWGKEAADRARVLSERSRTAAKTFTAAGELLESLASAEPQRAREYVLDTVVGAWARAASAHRDDETLALRHRAERIGHALAVRSGDSSVAHVAVELTDDPRVAAAAATGAKGSMDYLQTRYVNAQPELEVGVRELRGLRAPALADWLELTLAGLHIYRAEYTVAEQLFAGIAARAARRHDIALEARARWGLSLSRARRGAMTDGESAYVDASRQFDLIGEASNSASLKTIISEIRHALGRGDASDRDLYDALVGFHSHPRPDQRYALLLVLGTRLSERGQPYGAAAVVREAVLEAGATGREKDLPEALSRLATAESNLGNGAAAKRTIARARELLAGISDSVMRSRLDAEVARAEARVYRNENPKLAVDRLERVVSYFAAAHIPTDEAAVRVDRASLLLSLGDSAQAESDLARATSMAASYIGRNPNREASRAWLATQRDAYHQLVSIALARGDTGRAYEYSRYRRDAGREVVRESAAIEFVVLERQTLVWSTTNGSRRLTVFPFGDSTLTDRKTRFANLVRQNDDTLAELALGARLNELLIAPARASIAAAKAARVVIVPDGPLSGLPFAALRDANGRYLIEDVSLAYSDGRGVMIEPAEDGYPLADALLFGSPVWDRGLFPDLEPLRAVDREIRLSSVLYPRHTVVADSAATRSALLKEISQHDVVHFAGHARVVDDNPGASHLVLAKQPGGFGANVLYASDIAALRLNRVRLVVLSACGSTGTRFGRMTSNGLAEAFLDAGVRNVIASDWEADDAGTAALTPLLHRALRSGASPDEALRRAQLEMLRSSGGRLASPALWSGFRLSAASAPKLKSASVH